VRYDRAVSDHSAESSASTTTAEAALPVAKASGDKGKGKRNADVTPELRKLLELAVRYPEIGPTVASLAFKLGERELAERLTRMEGDRPSVEFRFVAAQAARREGRFDESLQLSITAVEESRERVAELGDEDLQRLLHLVRHGFAVALFDLGAAASAASLAAAYVAAAPQLETRLGGDHFFRTLLAQSLWFTDKDASEAEWERACELGDPESVWNARGTWYKDAEAESEKAEKAYRAGLDKAPDSSLLLHNVAQVLVARAEAHKDDVKKVRRWLNQADELLRRALRGDAQRMRRHIHATRDRLFELRRALPDPRESEGGEGRGGRGGRGGRDRNRGNGGPKPRRSGGPGRQGGGERSAEDRFLREGKASLGEALLHKLQEQLKNKS